MHISLQWKINQDLVHCNPTSWDSSTLSEQSIPSVLVGNVTHHFVHYGGNMVFILEVEAKAYNFKHLVKVLRNIGTLV